MYGSDNFLRTFSDYYVHNLIFSYVKRRALENKAVFCNRMYLMLERSKNAKTNANKLKEARK